MESELDQEALGQVTDPLEEIQEVLGQVTDPLEEIVEKRWLARLSRARAKAVVGKGTRRRQVWHYLIPALAVFWLAFAAILIASGFFFLLVALAIIALLSVLVIGLAWAFQNDI